MIIKDIQHAKSIHSWTEVPEGCLVIEDTYNELYQMHWVDRKPYLHHIGWRYMFNKPMEFFTQKPLDPPRLADFEPDCMYDQPWYMESI